MAFFEARFPDQIAQGAQGGPAWQTSSAKGSGGFRYANKDWIDPEHRFQCAQAVKSLEDFEAVRSFFYVVGGSCDAFRFKDFSNYRVPQSKGVLQATSTPGIYQLFKNEAFASRSYLRRIQKPVDGTVRVWRTRGGVTTLIAPPVDATTGLATISGHVALDTYAWAGEFDVPAHFADDSMESAQMIGQNGRLFMSWASIQIIEERFP